MADYSGTPTVNFWYEVGDKNGKRQNVRRNLTLSLTAAGGASNKIPVTALGFKSGYMYGAVCCLFTDGGAQKRVVWCFTDGTNLYIGDPTNATDATRGIPGDVTGTLVVECWGLPA